MRLTDQQSLRIDELPENYAVIGADLGALFVRKPGGQILGIQQNGRLTAATVAAKRKLGRRRDRPQRLSRDMLATPYTRVWW
jgi:hypothetical protein